MERVLSKHMVDSFAGLTSQELTHFIVVKARILLDLMRGDLKLDVIVLIQCTDAIGVGMHEDDEMSIGVTSGIPVVDLQRCVGLGVHGLQIDRLKSFFRTSLLIVDAAG